MSNRYGTAFWDAVGRGITIVRSDGDDSTTIQNVAKRDRDTALFNADWERIGPWRSEQGGTYAAGVRYTNAT